MNPTESLPNLFPLFTTGTAQQRWLSAGITTVSQFFPSNILPTPNSLNHNVVILVLVIKVINQGDKLAP